jgi:hypothetical protein
MKNDLQNVFTLELLNNFVLVNFPVSGIINAKTVEALLHRLLEEYQPDFPMLLDFSAIEGFSVDALELLLSLVLSNTTGVALVCSANQIGYKYARLIEMSVHKGTTKCFPNQNEASLWLLSRAYPS